MEKVSIRKINKSETVPNVVRAHFNCHFFSAKFRHKVNKTQQNLSGK